MTKVAMPTRAAFSVDGSLFWEGEHRHGESHDLITTTQAEVYADARVREALEEAAAVAEERSTFLPHYSDITRGYAGGRKGAAAAIRALIPKENT